jgi:hypothetical protein
MPNSLIKPDYGWDTLPITSPSMQHLLYHLGVFSQFFKYLYAFGMKTFALDEGFGGFDFCIEKDGGEEGGLKGIGSSPPPPFACDIVRHEISNLTPATETAYLLKYVDKKDSPKEFSNPWSIRQALIYQKSDITASQDTYIFMRLSELLGERFRDLLSKRKARERGVRFLHWSEIHTMAFRSVVANWREYINWLDGDVSQLVSSPIFASLQALFLYKLIPH